MVNHNIINFTYPEKNKNLGINIWTTMSNLPLPSKPDINFSTHTIMNEYFKEMKYMIKMFNKYGLDKITEYKTINILYKTSKCIKDKDKFIEPPKTPVTATTTATIATKLTLDEDDKDMQNKDISSVFTREDDFNTDIAINKMIQNYCNSNTTEYAQTNQSQQQSQQQQEQQQEQEQELENLTQKLTALLGQYEKYEDYSMNDVIGQKIFDSSSKPFVKFDYSKNILYSWNYIHKYMFDSIMNNNFTNICFGVIYLKQSKNFVILLPEEYNNLSAYYYADYDTYKSEIIVNINYNKFRIPGIKTMIDYMTDKQINNISDTLFTIQHFIDHSNIYSNTNDKHNFLDYIATFDTVDKPIQVKKIKENNIFRLIKAFECMKDNSITNNIDLFNNNGDTINSNDNFKKVFCIPNFSLSTKIDIKSINNINYDLFELVQGFIKKKLQEIYIRYKHHNDDNDERIIWKQYLDTTNHKTYYNTIERNIDDSIDNYFSYFKTYYIGNLIMENNQITEAYLERSNPTNINICFPESDDTIYSIKDLKYNDDNLVIENNVDTFNIETEPDIIPVNETNFITFSFPNTSTSLTTSPSPLTSTTNKDTKYYIFNIFKDNLFSYDKFGYNKTDMEFDTLNNLIDSVYNNKTIVQFDATDKKIKENNYNLHNLLIDHFLGEEINKNYINVDRSLMYKFCKENIKLYNFRPELNSNTKIITYADIYSFSRNPQVDNINIYRLSRSPLSSNQELFDAIKYILDPILDPEKKFLDKDLNIIIDKFKLIFNNTYIKYVDVIYNYCKSITITKPKLIDELSNFINVINKDFIEDNKVSTKINTDPEFLMKCLQYALSLTKLNENIVQLRNDINSLATDKLKINKKIIFKSNNTTTKTDIQLNKTDINLVEYGLFYAHLLTDEKSGKITLTQVNDRSSNPSGPSSFYNTSDDNNHISILKLLM